jgi:hypothetical protein
MSPPRDCQVSSATAPTVPCRSDLLYVAAIARFSASTRK